MKRMGRKGSSRKGGDRAGKEGEVWETKKGEGEGKEWPPLLGQVYAPAFNPHFKVTIIFK